MNESDNNTGEDTVASEIPAVPVCPRCMTPFDPLQHYCKKCGEAVGQLTPYIPFVNIPFNCSVFGTMWHRFWFDKRTNIGMKILFLFLIILMAPVMLLGLPFVIWQKARGNKEQSSSPD